MGIVDLSEALRVPQFIWALPPAWHRNGRIRTPVHSGSVPNTRAYELHSDNVPDEPGHRMLKKRSPKHRYHP